MSWGLFSHSSSSSAGRKASFQEEGFSSMSSQINRRRFMSNFAFASTALATGVGSWVLRPEWANAAADPIKVGIATDLTGPIGYAGHADGNVAKHVW